MMQIAKQQVASILQKLPEDCSLEDIQYHLYVLEKIKNGVSRAETEGVLSQQDAEQRLGKWMPPAWHKAKIRTHLTQI